MKHRLPFVQFGQAYAVVVLFLLVAPRSPAQDSLAVDLRVPTPLNVGQVYEAELRVRSQKAVSDAYVKISLPYALKLVSGQTFYRGSLDAAQEFVLRATFEVTGVSSGIIAGRALAYYGQPWSVFGRGQILYCRAAEGRIVLSDKSPEAEEDLRLEAESQKSNVMDRASLAEQRLQRNEERSIVKENAAGPKYRSRLLASEAAPENTSLTALLDAGQPKLYRFTGHRGDRIWVTARSEHLDPRLVLLRSDGTAVAEDDDGAGMLNARIPAQGAFELSSDDTYFVVVYDHGGSPGNIRLEIQNFTHLQPPPGAVLPAVRVPPARSAGAATADVGLTGKIIYNSADGGVSPVRFAVVRLFSWGFFTDTEIAAARTDKNGDVSLIVPQANRNDTLFIRVYTTDGGLGIASVQDPLLGLGLYHDAKMDTFTLPTSNYATFGTWNVAGAGQNGPFLIFDAAVEGYLISTEVLNTTASAIKVNYPIRNWLLLFTYIPPGDPEAYYNPANREIYIGELYYDSPDIVLHEYGHFLAATAGFSQIGGGNHTIGRKADASLAWGEGWATFYAVAGQNARGKKGKTRFVSKHPDNLQDYSLENGHDPSNSWFVEAEAGDENETSVAFVLWDLFDDDQDYLPVARSADTVGLGLKTIFDVAKNGAFLVVGSSAALYPVAYFERFYDGLFQQRSFGSGQIAAIQGVFRDQYIRWEVPPAPPVGLKFGWKGSAIALQWQPGSPNSVAYVIEQRLPGQAEFKLLGSSGSAEYVLGSVVVGASFQVTAYSDNTARFRALLPSGPSQQITYNAPPPTITCTYTLSSTAWSAPAGGGTGSVNVTTTAGCSWTATSNVNWITITTGSSGSGTGTVGFTAAANSSSQARTGTLTIAGQTLTVTQAGTALCSYSISPTSASAPASGGTGTVAVASTTGCSWTATSNVNWITVTSGTSGTGSGAVSYSVAANTGTSSRTGILTIAGQGFTITQAGASGAAVQLIATPPTVAFTYQIGGALPTGQTVSLTATGSGAVSFTFSAATNTGGNWLTVGATSTTTPATLAVLVNPSVLTALAAGDYWGVLVITAPGASNSPLVVKITLTVSQSLPNVTISSVVNGASFKLGFASSGWVTIMGIKLSRTTRIWRADEIVGGQLPTSLDGVRVNINHRPAFIYYISPTQLNVQAPTDEDHDWVEGLVEVEVIAPDGSAKTNAWKRRFAPGVFMFDPDGRRYVAAVHPDGTLVGRENLIPGAASRPAGPGDVIMLFTTGMGWATDPAVPAGQVVTTPAVLLNRVDVFVGGIPADVAFAGLVTPGLYQINLTVPEVADGDQTVVVQIAGVPSQEGAFVTTRR